MPTPLTLAFVTSGGGGPLRDLAVLLQPTGVAARVHPARSPADAVVSGLRHGLLGEAEVLLPVAADPLLPAALIATAALHGRTVIPIIPAEVLPGPALRRLLARADGLIFLDERTRDRARELGLDPVRSEVLPLGVAGQPFESQRVGWPWRRFIDEVRAERSLTRRPARAKRALDVLGAGLGLAATAPLIAGAAAAIAATMGRPVLFAQERPGLHGRPFTLKKFRTMRDPVPGRDNSDGARVTRLGRWLRATSVDELPTLLNVLLGDMTLVGPRPLLVRYLPRYSAEQARRHHVVPGVTGWAQVNGRNALSWDDKLRHDVWYVDNRTLWRDLRILARTVTKVLQREGIDAAGGAPMPEFMGPDAAAADAAEVIALQVKASRA